ncbi:MAG: hypothetical protein Q4B96_07725 [Bacillota bacterium]|nr:hypothetical protein [Bacillota bacterium]
MKKPLLLPVAVLLCLCLPAAAALANSAPTLWRGAPGLELLAVDEQCPIEVTDEQLSFDLRAMDEQGAGGRVTAVYQMYNPSAAASAVTMAFPLLSASSAFDADSVVISADGERLEYQLFYGQQVADGESVDIAALLGGLSMPAAADAPQGTLYSYEISAGQQLEFALDFELGEGMRVISSGFNIGGWDGAAVHLAASCFPDDPQQVSLYVIGDAPHIAVSAYTDNDPANASGDYRMQTEQRQLDLAEYVAAYLPQGIAPAAAEAEAALLLAETLALLEQQPFLDGYAIDELRRAQRVVALVYTVDFPAAAAREISVSYDIAATADGGSAPYWQYRLDYLLQPARYWVDFGSLQISVYTPEHSPYLLPNELPFEQAGDGLWQARLEELPEQDLSFTVYREPQLTRGDLLAKQLQNALRGLGYMLAFLWWLIVPLLAVLIWLIVRFVRRRRER